MMDAPDASPVGTIRPIARADGQELLHASAASAGIPVLVALCIASFLAALNFFATGPFYAQIARDLDTTVPLLGQVATLMIVVSTALGLAIGPLADRYGYRWPLTAGVLAVAINLVGTGLAPSFPVLIALGVVGGAADALVFGLPLAIAGQRFSGAAQQRAIAWTLGSLASAAIVGTPVLTAIGGAVGWRAALVVAGTAAGMAGVYIALALPPDAKRPETRLRWAAMREAYAPLLHHGPSVRLLGFSALRAVTWIGFLAYLGAFLADHVGLSTSRVGLVYTVSGLGLALGNAIGGRLPKRDPRRLMAGLTLTGAIIGAAVFTRTSVWEVAPLLFLLAVTSSIAGLLVAGLLVTESPAGPGTTMVLNGSMINAGSAAGTALGGALLALGGYDALAFGLPIFAMLAAALVWRRPAPSASAA